MTVNTDNADRNVFARTDCTTDVKTDITISNHWGDSTQQEGSSHRAQNEVHKHPPAPLKNNKIKTSDPTRPNVKATTRKLAPAEQALDTQTCKTGTTCLFRQLCPF
jgi:hypothetical protein